MGKDIFPRPRPRLLRWVAAMALPAVMMLLPSTFGGCGGSKPSGPMTGQIAISATMSIPEDKRAGVAAARSELAALGVEVAADGSSIILPDITPAGWRVSLGNQTVFMDSEGKFTVTVEAGGVTEGNLLHPNEDDSWGTFDVNQLVAEGQTPKVITILADFAGPAFMDSCCPLETSQSTKDSSYPAGNISCLDDNGPLAGSPLVGDNEYVVYVGSTCNQKVLAGCCTNERGSLTHLVTGTYKGCYQNHRGKVCQDLTQRDIVISPEETAGVQLDSTEEVSVHNNGCTGDTHVEKTLNEIGGEFQTETFFEGSTVKHYSGSDSTGYRYDGTDRTLTYITPVCVNNANARDTFTFQTDGVTKSLTFSLVGNLLVFTSGSSTGTVFNSDTGEVRGFTIADADTNCDGLHVHGNHPCTGTEDPDPTGCGHGKVANP